MHTQCDASPRSVKYAQARPIMSQIILIMRNAREIRTIWPENDMSGSASSELEGTGNE